MSNDSENRKEKLMDNCIFCKINSGEIPAKKVYEDDKITAFHDLDPQAPIHILMIPNKHIASMEDIREEDIELLGYMMNKIKEIAKLAGIENGYRTVINCGENAFQTVLHLHVHVLGNRKLNWPPG